MKLYEVNGIKRFYPDGKAPKGARLVTKARPAPKVGEPEEVKDEPTTKTKSKARRTPRNKSRKADNNK